jgi:hypothetical protein
MEKNAVCIFVLLFSTFFFPNLLVAQESDPKNVTAISANDFLNSIGVNSAVSRRGESLAKTIEITKYLGIRWIRSGYEGGLPVEDLIELHDQTGLQFSYGLLSGGTDIPKLLDGGKKLSATGALLAIEGSNEPNNWGYTYKGIKGGKDLTWLPVAQLQSDLYHSVKNDPNLKDIPVWSLSENGAETDNVGLQFLTIPNIEGTLMPPGMKYADYATCHNYFSHPSHRGLYDNQTWNAADPGRPCKVDGLWGNYGSTWRKHFPGYSEAELQTLPRVTTETGVLIQEEFTEERQASLYLNLYLSQFKRGWSYTAVYLLRDRSDESGNQQYGFYKADYSPRKSAVYLHNLTTLLADSIPTSSLKKLGYSIPDQPETTHDLLLQKGNGQFALVVWGEKVTGSDNITVNFGKKFQVARIYDPTIGTSATQTLANVKSILLTVSDHPLIIELDK